MGQSPIATEKAVQSFCARIIDFTYAVEGANTLTFIQGLKKQAERIRTEAYDIQDLHGGRVRKRKGKKA